MKENENENALHNDRLKFYKALVEDVAFRKAVTAYKQRLSELGHPLPIGGFGSQIEADRWISEVHRDYQQRTKNDSSYREQELAITKGREKWSADDMEAVEELRARLLPPYPYFQPLKKIMDNFVRGRKRDQNDFDFITNHVLFEKVEYYQTALSTHLKRGKNNELELWVQIGPNTRREDIVRNWPKIRKLQQQLIGYKERLRKSPTLERDLDGLLPDMSKAAKNRMKKRLR